MTDTHSANRTTSAPAAQEQAGTFVISRTFDAPRALVFKAWTQAEHLARWWGPTGFRIEIAKLDLRVGGEFHYCMRMPDGNAMWGIFVYREVTAPQQLVFVNAFADEQGHIVRAPFCATWPLEVLSTLSFTEHDGKTTLTMHGVPLGASAEECSMFEAGIGSMEQGWGGTLDQLAAHLARMQA